VLCKSPRDLGLESFCRHLPRSPGGTVSLPAQTVRFGSFQLDQRSAELRHNDTKTRLPEQPFQILVELVEHPGEVVTREELRQRLWRSDTFVDFEQGLNTAVKRLREALGDSAEKPRYIETLPRHGYRLVVPVERVEPVTGAVARPVAGRWKIWSIGLLVVAALTGGLLWRQRVREGFRPVKIESLAVLPLENLSGNPEESHRVRRKHQRLPPSLLIENASDRVPLRCQSVLPEAFPIKPSDHTSTDHYVHRPYVHNMTRLAVAAHALRDTARGTKTWGHEIPLAAIKSMLEAR
jgi:DNA-binding winged helix-turn-helix (wHTH) protein